MHRRPDRLPGTLLPMGSPPCRPPLLTSLEPFARLSVRPALAEMAIRCGLALSRRGRPWPSYRRPRRFWAKACVREYELFQRSNAMPPASPARPAAPTAATPLALLAALPTAPRPLPPLATTPLALLATARPRPFIDLTLPPR